MFNGWPEVSFRQQETCTLESSEGSRIQIGWQNRDRGLDKKTNQGVSQSQIGRTAGDSPEVPTQNEGLKGYPTLPKIHGMSHPKASIPEVSQGECNRRCTGNAIPVLGTASTPGGCKSIPHKIFPGYQPLCHPCQACHHHAQGHSAGQENPWRMNLRCPHPSTHKTRSFSGPPKASQGNCLEKLCRFEHMQG